MELDARSSDSSFEAANSLLQEIEMLDIRDIYSLTDFQRNTREHLARLKETGRAAVLTVNGRSEIVVQSAEAYQQMLDTIERAEAILGIQLGRQDVRNGDTLPLDEAFLEIRENATGRRS